MGAAGCGVEVTADTRLTEEQPLWKQLDGSTYALLAMEPQFESSLAFQETAATLQRALEAERPDLRRIRERERAGLIFNMQFSVADLGTQVYSQPVYRSYRVYRPGPRGRLYGYGGYYAGTRMDAVHAGFAHNLTVSVSTRSPHPEGRQVLWEGSFTCVRDTGDIRETMPYLAVAAARFYGESTGGRDHLRIKKKELPRVVRSRRGTRPPATLPQD